MPSKDQMAAVESIPRCYHPCGAYQGVGALTCMNDLSDLADSNTRGATVATNGVIRIGLQTPADLEEHSLSAIVEAFPFSKYN